MKTKWEVHEGKSLDSLWFRQYDWHAQCVTVSNHVGFLNPLILLHDQLNQDLLKKTCCCYISKLAVDLVLGCVTQWWIFMLLLLTFSFTLCSFHFSVSLSDHPFWSFLTLELDHSHLLPVSADQVETPFCLCSWLYWLWLILRATYCCHTSNRKLYFLSLDFSVQLMKIFAL